MKTITFISDTHNKHKQIDLPGGDILIHSGDISSVGYEHEVRAFLDWFEIQNYKYKIFIAGNHDFLFQLSPSIAQQLLDGRNGVYYLENSEIEIEGIRFYGSPITPQFYNWAFMRSRGEDIRLEWDKIPNGVDVLITHGPAMNRLDTVIGIKDHLGCMDLYNKIQEIRPKIHCSGHIHSGRGVVEKDNICYINASVLNEQYRVEYDPITLVFDEVKKEIIEFKNEK